MQGCSGEFLVVFEHCDGQEAPRYWAHLDIPLFCKVYHSAPFAVQSLARARQCLTLESCLLRPMWVKRIRGGKFRWDRDRRYCDSCRVTPGCALHFVAATPAQNIHMSLRRISYFLEQNIWWEHQQNSGTWKYSWHWQRKLLCVPLEELATHTGKEVFTSLHCTIKHRSQ